MIVKFYILLVLVFGYLLIFSCRDAGPDDPNPPTPKDSCIVIEPILDSISKIRVYTIKDSILDFGYATKVNTLSFFNLGVDRNNERILIHLFSQDQNGDLSDLLIFSLKKVTLGCYDIKADCNRSGVNGRVNNCSVFETNYGDVLINSYILDTNRIDNKVEIVSIDTVQKIIEGRFACTFIFPQDRVNLDPGNPDTIRFFNGYFKGRYMER
ncbi:MAG: hypothetical protein IPI50_08785 [Saprospiraceae bacterium]|nr:hypothetical protein [Saprospiraceae bacterium]